MRNNVLKLDYVSDYMSGIHFTVVANRNIYILFILASVVFSTISGVMAPGPLMQVWVLFGSVGSLILTACVLIASHRYLLTKGRIADFAALQDARLIIRVTLRLLLIVLLTLLMVVAFQILISLVEFSFSEPSGPTYYSGEKPIDMRRANSLMPLVILLITFFAGLIWGVRIPHAIDKGYSERNVSGFRTVIRQRGRILRHVFKGYLVMILIFILVMFVVGVLLNAITGGNTSAAKTFLELFKVGVAVGGVAMFALVLTDVYLNDRAENPELYVSDAMLDEVSPPNH